MNEAIEYACQHLPERWDITINLERGSGSLTLQNPELCDVANDEFCSESDDSLETQLVNAVVYAVGHDHLFE
jgi:hypothetical protein